MREPKLRVVKVLASGNTARKEAPQNFPKIVLKEMWGTSLSCALRVVDRFSPSVVLMSFLESHKKGRFPMSVVEEGFTAAGHSGHGLRRRL